MKKAVLILSFILCALVVKAQEPDSEDASVKLDLLKAPVSPASNLLGIASSDIDKPTDISSFMLSLQSGTNSFTKLPSNYAIDIAPYWLFKKKVTDDISTVGLGSQYGANVLKQTFVLSFAIRNADSTETGFNPQSTYGGLGLKFSVFRGKYDDETNNALDKIKELQKIKLRALDSLMIEYRQSSDQEVIALRARRKELFQGINVNTTEGQAAIRTVQNSEEYKAIEKRLNEKLKTLKNAEFSQTDKMEALQLVNSQIQEIASTFQTNRVGFTWDINAGISSEFVNKRFDNSRVHNAGVWTNLGYTTKTGSSFLFLVRFLHNPNQIFAADNAANDMGDISTLDGGFKYAFSKSQSKFNCSVESIYRSVLTENTIDPSWRLLLNADYAIWQNQKLTFSFGRNFDGAVTKDGNLVAALTFLTGFGNKR